MNNNAQSREARSNIAALYTLRIPYKHITHVRAA